MSKATANNGRDSRRESAPAEIRVSNWNELNDALFAGAWQPELGRFRSTYAFRGMTDAANDLSTSLMRLGGPYARHEGHLLRNFRKYAHRDAVPGDSVWNWLSLAQHHGLPTRLLDWSFSPHVAMHFATQRLDGYQVDGVIWAVDYVRAHALLPAKFRKVLKEEHADVFTAELLERIAGTLPDFDRLDRGHAPFAVFLEPPSLDDRIVNQFALFSFMSSPEVSMDEWIARHPELCRKIVIPAAMKWEVRDKLDQANITERVLFPGLDGLSRWLLRYYSPRLETPDEVVPRGREGEVRETVTEATMRPSSDQPPPAPRRQSSPRSAGRPGSARPAGNGTSPTASGARAARRPPTRPGRARRGT